MNELAHVNPENEPADANYCAKVVKMLLSGYPNQEPKDPKTYAKFLIAALEGKPKRVVRRVVDPNEGLIAVCQFLPTVADLRKWIEPYLPKSAPVLPEHRRLLPEPPEPEIPDEERRAGAAKLRELARAMRERQKENDRRRFGIKPLDWKQVHDGSKLVDALARLCETRAKALEAEIGGEPNDAADVERNRT
jgi:hypothetical protein